MRKEEPLSPQPHTAAKTDWQDKPTRSADGTKRAAGQRPEHWASHVSLGSKPQHRCLPPQASSWEEWAPLSFPARGHRGTSSKALFMCGAWPKDFLLPGSRLAQQSSLIGVGAGLGALTPQLVPQPRWGRVLELPCGLLNNGLSSFSRRDTRQNAHPWCQ